MLKCEASHAGALPLYKLEVGRHQGVEHSRVVLQMILQGQLLMSECLGWCGHLQT